MREESALMDKASELLEEMRRDHADAEVLRVHLASTATRVATRLEELPVQIRRLLEEAHASSTPAPELRELRDRLEVATRRLESLSGRINTDTTSLLHMSQRMAVLLMGLSMITSLGVVGWFAHLQREAAQLNQEVATLEATAKRLEKEGGRAAVRECVDSEGRQRLCVRVGAPSGTAGDQYYFLQSGPR